jgi:hypothetical protein
LAHRILLGAGDPSTAADSVGLQTGPAMEPWVLEQVPLLIIIHFMFFSRDFYIIGFLFSCHSSFIFLI